MLISQDPPVPDWANMPLPKSWVDRLDFRKLSSWRKMFGRRVPVQLPSELLGRECIPAYALQEFHNLPNGNYSNRLTRGYIKGFDVSMLGRVQPVRQWMAEQLVGAGGAILDVGTGGGKTAATLAQAGKYDVWGLDPSPYLLKHAATEYPAVKFVQGIAEDLPFPDKRFDAITVCFVFHEIPPKYIAQALQAFSRVLKPGAKVCIAEPSAEQFQPFQWRQWRAWQGLFSLKGWLTVYFRLLARHVHEPFVPAWHNLDKQACFEKAGFKVLEERLGMPINCWLLGKI